MQNSELQKAVWEEFSLPRVLIMPLVILLIAASLYLAAGENDPNQSIQNMASAGFSIVTILWGTYQAVHAVPKEVRNNTWDNLRLSPISPWSLVIGKLFGSTLYQWYGAFILLILYFCSASNLHGAIPALLTTLSFIGIAVLSQSVGMLASLMPLRKQNNGKQLPAFGGFIVSLLLMSSLYTPAGQVFYTDKADVVWYGMHVAASTFLMVTLCVALFWVFCAIYRIIRAALQFKNRPLVWTAFVVFSMLCFPGFIPDASLLSHLKLQMNPALMHIASGFTLAFFIGLTYTYLNFLMDNLSVIRYRSLLNAIRGKQPSAIAYAMPLWLVSLSLTIVAALPVITLCFTSDGATISLLILTTLLFTIRDGCIFHYFSLLPKERIPHFATFCCMFLLYGLLPGVAGLMGFTGAKYIFFPNMNFPLEGTLINGTAIVIQVLVLGFFLKKRYHHLTKGIGGRI